MDKNVLYLNLLYGGPESNPFVLLFRIVGKQT